MNSLNTISSCCNNCGKSGHSFHQCKLPITSYGVIVFRKKNDKYEFLMIRRKNSFGYIDFIRGKYSPYNIYQIQNIINEMSNAEKELVMSSTFEQLWKNMWGENASLQYKNEESISQKKMNLLINGMIINNENITLKTLIERSTTDWCETEWEFPKGRRNYREKDIECALREFEEETGIPQKNIEIIENILPFEEIFIGTNHKSYKHKYFLAYLEINNNMNTLDNYQKEEVSKMDWKSIDQCLKSIRPYNLEKKELIKNINSVLEEYRLYS